MLIMILSNVKSQPNYLRLQADDEQLEKWEDDEFDLELAVEINAAAKEAFTAAQETKACTPLLQLYLFFLFML